MLHASAALSARADRDDAVWQNNIVLYRTRARRLEGRDAAAGSHCAAYKGSIPSRAWTQILTTAVPFVAIVVAMFAFVNTHYWLTLLLALPGGGLLVRFFIIQHDCGHGSFWSTRAANDLTGRIMSVLTMAPYGLWRREHAQHHATSGNLDKRGVGDITTLTIKEYQALSPMRRVVYRIYRHPLFLFGFGVPFFFVIHAAVALVPSLSGARDVEERDGPQSWRWPRFMGRLPILSGLTELFFVAWPMLHVATAAGGWLFFVQHQFEETEWDTSKDWSFQPAALHGSSFL